MRISILAILAVLVSCSKATEKPKAGPLSKIEELRSAYEKKKDEAKEKFDKETGWPSKEDCDGTLWAGLARAAGVDSVAISLADYGNGKIHRRPGKPCWEGGKDLGSKSTVSRDMLLGYFWGQWAARDFAKLRDVAQYGEHHNWVMGEPFPEEAGRVLMTGNLIGLLGRLLKKDGTDKIYRKIQPLHSKSDTDYVRHLTVLFILLDGEAREGERYEWDAQVRMTYPPEVTTMDVKPSEKELLRWHAEKDPNDALFGVAFHLYEDGDFNKVADQLLDENFVYPTYVRGHENYKIVHWLFVANQILKRYN